MRKVKNTPYLLDSNGNISENLKEYEDPQIEKVLNEMSVFTFRLLDFKNIHTEQEIMYRDERYRVTRVSEYRGEAGKYTEVEAMSAFIELNDMRTINQLEFINLKVREGVKRILSGTDWEVGEVEEIPDDDLLHSFKESDQTILWCIRQFARISGYEVAFDTINKKVNFVLQIGKQTDEIIRYRKNLRGITKIEEPTRATVIYPRGRGGLTIHDVNNNTEYIEDYSWYTEELGIPLSEARQKYRKEYIWEDDRFIYAGNLKRAAEKKIHELSRPFMSYETSVLYLGTEDIDVGDYAWIIDEELNIRLSVRAVRIVDKPGREEENEIEFNYLIPGLGNMQEHDGELDKGEIETILVKNEQAVSIGKSYNLLLELSVSSFASTNLQAGLYIIGQSTEKTLLTGYMTFNGERFGPEIKQTVDGWATIGLPLTILQMQEGTGYLLLYLSVENGTFNVARHDSELFITGMNLLGGLSNKLPRANVLEEVKFIPPIHVIDQVSVTTQHPITIDIGEEVEFIDYIDVVDQVKLAIINRGSLTPEMLSNDKPDPFYIYADTSDADHQPYLAMDKWIATYWKSTSENSRLTIDLGNEKQADYYVLVMEDVEVSWQLVASNDEVDWIILDENSYEFEEKEEVRFDIDEADNYRYYRLVFDNDESLKVYEYDLLSEVLLANE